MICPVCKYDIEAEAGSTLDYETMIQRAHAILHEPWPRTDLAAIRRDIAGVLIAIDQRLRTTQAPPETAGNTKGTDE